MQISVSRLRTYQLCPQQFYFRYIASVAPEFTSANLLFGTAIHHSIAQFHKSENTIGSEGMYQEFLRYWQAAAEDAGRTKRPIRFAKDGEADLLDKASKLCVEYAAVFADTVLASKDDVEVMFEFPLFDPTSGVGTLNHTLTGRIDLLSNEAIYEFKTSSRAMAQNEADRSLQLSAYALAYTYLYDQLPEQLFVVNLIKTKIPKIQILETTRSHKDFADVIDCGRQVARAIEHEIFYRNREYQYGCQNCEYSFACF